MLWILDVDPVGIPIYSKMRDFLSLPVTTQKLQLTHYKKKRRKFVSSTHPVTNFLFLPNTFGLIVSWGVFHYNKREDAKTLLQSLLNAMAKDGYLVGSIRAEGDTHLGLKAGKMNLTDLSGGYAETYSLSELKEFLSPFSEVSIGYSERTPLGKLNERICHWFFLAKK